MAVLRQRCSDVAEVSMLMQWCVGDYGGVVVMGDEVQWQWRTG